MATTLIRTDTRNITTPVNAETYLFVFDDIFRNVPERMAYLFPGFVRTNYDMDFIGPVSGFIPPIIYQTPTSATILIKNGIAQIKDKGLVVKKPVQFAVSNTTLLNFKTANTLSNTFTCIVCFETRKLGCDTTIVSSNVDILLAKFEEATYYDGTIARVGVVALDVKLTDTGTIDQITFNPVQTAMLFY